MGRANLQSSIGTLVSGLWSLNFKKPVITGGRLLDTKPTLGLLRAVTPEGGDEILQE